MMHFQLSTISAVFLAVFTVGFSMDVHAFDSSDEEEGSSRKIQRPKIQKQKSKLKLKGLGRSVLKKVPGIKLNKKREKSKELISEKEKYELSRMDYVVPEPNLLNELPAEIGVHLICFMDRESLNAIGQKHLVEDAWVCEAKKRSYTFEHEVFDRFSLSKFEYVSGSSKGAECTKFYTFKQFLDDLKQIPEERRESVVLGLPAFLKFLLEGTTAASKKGINFGKLLGIILNTPEEERAELFRITHFVCGTASTSENRFMMLNYMYAIADKQREEATDVFLSYATAFGKFSVSGYEYQIAMREFKKYAFRNGYIDEGDFDYLKWKMNREQEKSKHLKAQGKIEEARKVDAELKRTERSWHELHHRTYYS